MKQKSSNSHWSDHCLRCRFVLEKHGDFLPHNWDFPQFLRNLEKNFLDATCDLRNWGGKTWLFETKKIADRILIHIFQKKKKSRDKIFEKSISPILCRIIWERQMLWRREICFVSPMGMSPEFFAFPKSPYRPKLLRSCEHAHDVKSALEVEVLEQPQTLHQPPAQLLQTKGRGISLSFTHKTLWPISCVGP